MWVAMTDLLMSASHPFCSRRNPLLRDRRFDAFAETTCAEFYAQTDGPAQRPSTSELPNTPDIRRLGRTLNSSLDG
jgi:hypothetical protein